MRLRVVFSALILALAATVTPAFGQNDSRFALIASFPAPTVSVQWEMNERFAIRVDGSYTFRDQTIDEVTTTGSFRDLGTGLIVTAEQTRHLESATNTASIAASGIFTIRRENHLHLYVAPRLIFGFTRQTSTLTTTTSSTPSNPLFGVIFGTPLVDDGPQTTKDTYSSNGAGLSFGASSDVFDRVALFGEIGANYIRTDGPASPLIVSSSSVRIDSSTATTTVSTRAVAGIMFRF
jgi:hypothetical protein